MVTDSLSTRMAVEGDTNSKNPNEEKEKITLFWVPGHMGIPGNKTADEEAKKR
jgi:ribonuclease HI